MRHGATILAQYRHNTRGKLLEMTNSNGGTFSFTYDGNGVRVHKSEKPDPTAPARVTIEPFSMYRTVDGVVEKYYFAAGRMIARRTGPDSGSVSWYHPEHLGSTNLMTGVPDAQGQVHEFQDAYSEYTPYGSALPTKDNNTAGLQAGKNTPNSRPLGRLPIHWQGAG